MVSGESVRRFLLCLPLSFFLGAPWPSFPIMGKHRPDTAAWRIEAWAQEKGSTPMGVMQKVAAESWDTNGRRKGLDAPGQARGVSLQHNTTATIIKEGYNTTCSRTHCVVL